MRETDPLETKPRLRRTTNRQAADSYGSQTDVARASTTFDRCGWRATCRSRSRPLLAQSDGQRGLGIALVDGLMTGQLRTWLPPLSQRL
jgi:hypothetical protein